jgi:hypothetical protein
MCESIVIESAWVAPSIQYGIKKHRVNPRQKEIFATWGLRMRATPRARKSGKSNYERQSEPTWQP